MLKKDSIDFATGCSTKKNSLLLTTAWSVSMQAHWLKHFGTFRTFGTFVTVTLEDTLDTFQTFMIVRETLTIKNGMNMLLTVVANYE